MSSRHPNDAAPGSPRHNLSALEADCRSRDPEATSSTLDRSPTPHLAKDRPVNRLQAVRRPSASTPHTSEPNRDLGPQMRAADILGRIIEFFDALEASSSDVLERTRGLLVDELEVSRTDATRAPHDNRRRNAVFASALACVQAASERGALRTDVVVEGPSWLQATGGAARERPIRPGTIILRIHHVLDGVKTLHDPALSEGRPRGVDVLAHMLRGPEPRTWSRDQQDFARCALEWMRAGTDEGTASPAGVRRWSTTGRRGGLRPGDSTGVVRSA